MRRVRAALGVVAVTAVVWPSAARASNDPFFNSQWALMRVGADLAWGQSTGAGVRIGIVDTGVDLAHEDLVGKVVAHASCVDSEGDSASCTQSAQDDNGHGTRVAGIAAAWKDNGKGIAGVAPDAELVVAKVLSATGAGSTSDVTIGVKWVVDHGAKVVNLSLGDPTTVITSPSGGGGNYLGAAINYAWSHGAVPVIAAGNSNALGLGLGESAYGDINAVIVGATDSDDKVATYSSPTGKAKWAVVAPGGAGDRGKADSVVGGDKARDVLSTAWVSGKQNSYEARAGTSMAAAHVSGALALLLAKGHSPHSAVQTLLRTADKGVGCGANSSTCQGRIDVAKAVAAPVPRG